VDGEPQARVSLLDGFAVEVDACARPAAGDDLPRGVQRLIAHLSLSGRPGRAAIAGQLWPNVPERLAQARLRSALWRLQKAVPGLVHVSGGALRLADSVRVDVRELGDWAKRVMDPHAEPDGVVTLPVALHAELLPGWYEDWVLYERERLRQLRMRALEILAEKLARAGRYGEAIEAAQAAVYVEPLRESAQRVLVAAHFAEGNAVEALRAYESFRSALADELSVVPTGLMEELVLHIRSRRPADVPHGAASRPG
jgi:DNA-binding SARP family transcriptional activator